MSKNRDYHADMISGEDDSGWMSRILAEEDEFDRKAMWRLGSWGFATVGIIVAALVVARSPLADRRDQLAAMDAQSRQVQWIAKESQNSARQLAAAVETLNGDRDRLYARVTMLEQNLDSVTGSIAKQPVPATAIPALPPSTPQAAGPSSAEIAAATPVKPDAPAKPDAQAKPDMAAAKTDPLPRIEAKEPPPKIGPVASVPAAPPGEKKTAETERKEPIVTGTLTPNAAADTKAADSAQEKPAQRTAFGVDLGNAKSVEGLRGVWRSITKSSGTSLQGLAPIVAIKEGTDGLGMRLHLIAGPLDDAAAAAKICAAITESKRPCETAVYDGQRMAMSDGDPNARPKKRRAAVQDAPPPRSSFSAIFGR